VSREVDWSTARRELSAPPLDRADGCVVRSGLDAEVPITTRKRKRVPRCPQPTRKEVDEQGWELKKGLLCSK
jgi:hypothetical protein